MKSFQRAYQEADQKAALRLLLETRTGKSLERYPTFWRLQQELATRLWKPERDARTWENASGQILAAAALVSRTSDALSRQLEYVIHPQVSQVEIFTEILAWADTRVLEKAVQHQATYTLSVSHDADKKEFATLLESHKYILNYDVYDLYMSCSLTISQILPPKVNGFTFRLLNGFNELEAYMELFGFAAMTREHRSELLMHPDEYTHFVAVTPENRMVAYCEVSISRQEWALQPRRIGWVDYVGTRKEFRQRGLGHALLLHGLQGLQDWGAECAMLVTMSTNIAAQHVFQSVGFLPTEQRFYYKKQLEP